MNKRNNLQGQVVRLETINLHLQNQLDKYKEVLDKIKEYVSGENANYLIENAESHLAAKAIDEILGDILELLEEIDNE